MQEVFIVDNESKSKAEDLLKNDDLISRGSIVIKSPASIDIKEDGYFFVLDASEETIKHAEELLKGIGKKYKEKEKVINKIKEQEEAAAEGFGNILG